MYLGDHTHLSAPSEQNCDETSVEILEGLEVESKVALEKLEPFIRNYIVDFELGMSNWIHSKKGSYHDIMSLIQLLE